MKSRFHPEAVEEMFASAHYYEAKEAGLGMDFLSAVERAVGLVASFPNAGTKEAPAVRRQVVRGFPFFLVYEQLQDDVRIIAVVHQSRRPHYWTARLP